MEWITTTTVLDRLRDANDHSAWSSFVERFRAPITGFSRKLGLNLADAEDVAQETLMAFLESYRKNAYERRRGRLGHYLFGIAHNKILLARRKIGAREGQVSGTDDRTSFWSALPDSSQAQETWEREWRDSILVQCLEQVRQEVSPQTFEAFRMVVLEEIEPATVAERLGLTRNAVFIAKHRVGTRLRGLRAAFEEEL
ncbi:MAG TPA: sigma-70 family RNA polymerase sigma factor [Phycisphaerae bacterium]|nr:sigma-70 family RNA polymerase sigma factor [Phycisphaerae bacterium]